MSSVKDSVNSIDFEHMDTVASALSMRLYVCAVEQGAVGYSAHERAALLASHNFRMFSQLGAS